MEKIEALAALAALAHATRLDIYRLLVAAGPEGRAAGRIGAALGLAPATLSFHLKELKVAGLVECRRNGRSLIYVADFARMSGLMGFLSDNCCRGNPELCLPALRPSKRTRLTPRRGAA